MSNKPKVTVEQKERAERIQKKLDILWNKLDQEGMYTSCNTIHFAQVLIGDLTGIYSPSSNISN